MTRTTVRSVRAALAALGFLAAAHMAHASGSAAAPADGGTCTTHTEIRADGAIITHKVCTYILRNSR